ncbi:hypothetical protein HK104_004498 [Borealophlyctis nickersoniae]|nr:hypothetical protein HK104_004498 [Borealophlyctis nickersoniae]
MSDVSLFAEVGHVLGEEMSGDMQIDEQNSGVSQEAAGAADDVGMQDVDDAIYRPVGPTAEQRAARVFQNLAVLSGKPLPELAFQEKVEDLYEIVSQALDCYKQLKQDVPYFLQLVDSLARYHVDHIRTEDIDMVKVVNIPKNVERPVLPAERSTTTWRIEAKLPEIIDESKLLQSAPKNQWAIMKQRVDEKMAAECPFKERGKDASPSSYRKSWWTSFYALLYLEMTGHSLKPISTNDPDFRPPWAPALPTPAPPPIPGLPTVVSCQCGGVRSHTPGTTYEPINLADERFKEIVDNLEPFPRDLLERYCTTKEVAMKIIDSTRHMVDLKKISNATVTDLITMTGQSADAARLVTFHMYLGDLCLFVYYDSLAKAKKTEFKTELWKKYSKNVKFETWQRRMRSVHQIAKAVGYSIIFILDLGDTNKLHECTNDHESALGEAWKLLKASGYCVPLEMLEGPLQEFVKAYKESDQHQAKTKEDAMNKLLEFLTLDGGAGRQLE